MDSAALIALFSVQPRAPSDGLNGETKNRLGLLCINRSCGHFASLCRANLYICGRVVFFFVVKLSTLRLKIFPGKQHYLIPTVPKAIVSAKPTRTMRAFTFQFTGGGRGPWKRPRDISYRALAFAFFLAARRQLSPRRGQSIIRRAPHAKVLLRLARNFWGNCRASAPCHGAPFQKPKAASI